MPVGAPISSGQIDNIITSLAVNMRTVMQQVSNLNLAVNGQGTGLAYLESIGYGSDANPANPGGISDAQYAMNMIGYLNTMAGLYFGTATQATTFDFDQELSQVWAGRVELCTGFGFMQGCGRGTIRGTCSRPGGAASCSSRAASSPRRSPCGSATTASSKGAGGSGGMSSPSLTG